MDPLLARLRRLTADRDDCDGALLDRYAATGDPAAVEELVRRHGPLVWAAARRRLPDPDDAADVFQATFLVLLRKGRRLAGAPAVGPWLYRVAALTARNLRRKNARRLARRRPLLDVAVSPAHELRADLDDALLTLPERDRAAVVLCHLQGYSRQEAAERLGLPEGTLSSLLNRALAKLRRRLGDDPLPLLVVGSTVPASVATAAVRTAAAVRVASLAAAGTAVATLTTETIRMFWPRKLVAGSLAALACLGLGFGVGLTPRPAAVAADPPTAGPATPKSKADPDAVLWGTPRVSIRVSADGGTGIVWSEYDGRLSDAKTEPPFLAGTAREPWALRHLLDRLRRDVDASRPRTIDLRIDPGVKPAAIAEVAQAINAGGYRSVRYTGPLPAVATVDGKPRPDWDRAVAVVARPVEIAEAILYTEPPRCRVYVFAGGYVSAYPVGLTGQDTVATAAKRAGIEDRLTAEDVQVVLLRGGSGHYVFLDRTSKPDGTVIYVNRDQPATGDVMLMPGDAVNISKKDK